MSKRKSSARHKSKPSPAVEDRRVVCAAPALAVQRRIAWLVGAMLLINILVPLRWYVGLAEDERFCWRMFSSNSLQRSQVAVWETIEKNGRAVERKVSFPTIVQPAWAKFFYKYHQPALIRRLLSEHCRQTPAQSVRFQRTGIWSDGSPVEPFVLTHRCAE